MTLIGQPFRSFADFIIKRKSKMPDPLKINQWLKDHYGNMVGADVPKYRVSWSTGQTEKRYIKDRAVFSPSGNIFLRYETGVFEVPKYPFCKDRWVLEKACPAPQFGQIKDTNISYEPLWVFQTNSGAFLPLERKAIRLLLYFYENPELTRKTPGQLEDEEKQIEAREVAEFEEKLEDIMTPWNQMKDLVE